MNILIASIMRNSSNVVERYWNQIDDFITRFGDEHNWYVSIYENDSTDNTPELIRKLDISNLKGYSIISETLNTKSFGSVVEEERVKNLSIARNKALYAKDMIQKVDKVLWIEPDVAYTWELIDYLLHPERYNIDPDIYSGLNCDPNRGFLTYDTWATRRDEHEESGERFPDWQENPVREFYATFNAVVVYNAEPIKKGISFGWFNKRLNKFDCDTVVICENFREAGYNKIYINQHLACFHD